MDAADAVCDNRRVSPSVLVLLAGVLFASGGALLKACDFPPMQRAALRAAFAAATMFVLLPQARRWPGRAMLWIAPAYIGTTCLYVFANALTTAANAIFLQSTAPLWLLLLGPWLLHERPSRRDMVTLIGVAAGMTMCLVAPTEVQATAPNPFAGDVLAAVSGVCFAFVLLGMRRLSRDAGRGSAGAIAWSNALTAPLAFALMPFVGPPPVVGDASDWAVMIFLGVVQIGLAYTVLVRAMPLVPAVRASLLLMIEPALNPAIAWFVHGERPPGLAIGGGALIVGSVLATSLLARRRAPA